MHSDQARTASGASAVRPAPAALPVKSDPSAADSPLGKAEREGFTAFKLMKPFFEKNLPGWSKPRVVNLDLGNLRCNAEGLPLDRAGVDDPDAVVLQMSDGLRAFVGYGVQAMQGVTDSKGNLVDPPKPLDLSSLIPHTGSATLPKFYCLLPHKPPVGAAILSKMKATQKKTLESKDVTISRKLLDHVLEGFRRVMDIGSYLEWMMKGLILSGALDGADKVAQAILVSTRQAINNLNAVSSVCNANVTSFRRQEVIKAFKADLPDDAIRKLREAPFDSRDLIPDELFREVIKETREARHDDVLLEPIRQRQQYRRAPYSPVYRGGAGGRGGGKGKGRGQYVAGRGRGEGGYKGQDQSFRGNFRRQSGGKGQASQAKGGKGKGNPGSGGAPSSDSKQ